VGRYSEIQATGLLNQAVDVTLNGTTVSCIQVHPTFLYESLWNICLLLFIFCYRKRKKFDGELLGIYLMGYGIGRFWIESLRVDQLTIGNTGLAVSQILSFMLVVGSAVSMGIFRYQKRKRSMDDDNIIE
jgi:phosphatidylglycerol:prolipoprotein diacylglycerol transferase